ADPLSPVAAARVRVQLLPVGRIKRCSFKSFVALLEAESTVRLGDVTPDSRPNRTMFSPLAFPNGSLLYDFSTAFPSASRVALAPFELFREPFVILGVADGAEYNAISKHAEHDDARPNGLINGTDPVEELRDGVAMLREEHPRALVHNLLVFNSSSPDRHAWMSEETILVPPAEQLKTTTMKTIICDLTSTLLAEMTSFAKSIQALPSIPSPSPSSHSSRDTPSQQRPVSLSRSNSQMSNGTRSRSPLPSRNTDYRMSMPAHLPSSSATSGTPDSLASSQPTSPSEGTKTPPTTFEDMPGIERSSSAASSGNSKMTPRPLPGDMAKNASSDRVSVQGFGSGSVSERARNKGKSRVGLVIGSFYLLAGRWQDALRELSEGARIARSLSDHLWHAKGLENVLVCLLLLGWSGMDFQIPQICYPIAEKTSSTKSPHHTPSSSATDVSRTDSSTPSSNAVALQNLAALLPDLINMILGIYNRSAAFAGEALPTLALSESTIRLSRLLATVYVEKGALTQRALRHAVMGAALDKRPDNRNFIAFTKSPSRHEVASMVFRAHPLPSELSALSFEDQVVILAGISSVLSTLQLQRKKGIVMKEMVSILIRGLVQARKVGAAEMGVHPAAGLSAMNLPGAGPGSPGSLNMGDDEVDAGLDSFLMALGRIYGIIDLRVVSKVLGGPLQDPNSDTLRELLLRKSSLRFFGSVHLKHDILRACINFCEALPDFQGVLNFSSTLLATAGPGSAPSPNSTNVFVALAREEQLRLANNISRTVSAAAKLGLQDVETDYWDDFLVRGVHVIDPPAQRFLTPHKQTELERAMAGQAKEKKSPFIHNPFLKEPTTPTAERLLVAGDRFEFVVALQNPYEFDVQIDELRLKTEGVPFESGLDNLVLGPYRTQKFTVVCTAKASGSLRIYGCEIKVRGCRLRTFPIYSKPWTPERDTRVKAMGLSATDPAHSRPISGVSTSSKGSKAAPNYPEASSLEFTVLAEQPILTAPYVSLPQSALMILEGERKIFTVTLQNHSNTAPADFVHLSFQDSSTSSLQASLGNKGLTPTEIHELEYQLAKLPAFRWRRTANQEEGTVILPGGTATFEIEVLGKPGLTDAVIQFDYANIGVPREEVKGRFYTRKLSVPITVTVNVSVQLHRLDVVPFSGDFAWWNQQRRLSRKHTGDAGETPTNRDLRFKLMLNQVGFDGKNTDYCLLLLDFRNAWPNPLSIFVQVLDDRITPDTSADEDAQWASAFTVHDTLQPGTVSRLVLLLPKQHIPDPYAPIPSLNPANQRQFVVSNASSRVSPEAERAAREAFWFRDALLRLVRGGWREDANPALSRSGAIDLRGARLGPSVVEAMRLDDVDIDLAVEMSSPSSSPSPLLPRQLGRARFAIPIDRFVTLRASIRNRSRGPLRPLLRLQPALAAASSSGAAALSHGLALDLDKRLAVSGALQRGLGWVAPGGEVAARVALCALCEGMFEVGASVEEMVVGRAEEDED
ncbi:hypercellular protein A, partial [Lineolata rhizophorae]